LFCWPDRYAVLLVDGFVVAFETRRSTEFHIAHALGRPGRDPRLRRVLCHEIRCNWVIGRPTLLDLLGV
jgi:hypothetical protein